MIIYCLGPASVNLAAIAAKLFTCHKESLAVLTAVWYHVFEYRVNIRFITIRTTRAANVSLAHRYKDLAWRRRLSDKRANSRFFQIYRTGNSETIGHSKSLLCKLGLFSKFFSPKNVQKWHYLHKMLEWGAEKIEEILEQRIVILDIAPSSSP